jgi:hypothetical protein
VRFIPIFARPSTGKRRTMKFVAGRGLMNRSCRRTSPQARGPSSSKTGCPSGRTISFSGPAFQPINQPSYRHSRPGISAPEYVRSTTASKPTPRFVAGRVLTNMTCPEGGGVERPGEADCFSSITRTSLPAIVQEGIPSLCRRLPRPSEA